MSNTIELRACPFCGGRAARVRRIKLPTITAHTVRCECGASVANYDTRKAAIHAWNGGMLFKWKGARPGKCGKNAKKLIEETHRELAAVKEGK